jgi:hypothetical protein
MSIGVTGFLVNPSTATYVGVVGFNVVVGATVVTSSGGGGGSNSNNWRLFPEANTIRFFPNDILRGFPTT